MIWLAADMLLSLNPDSNFWADLPEHVGEKAGAWAKYQFIMPSRVPL
jgi:hypothetical protein